MMVFKQEELPLRFRKIKIIQHKQKPIEASGIQAILQRDQTEIRETYSDNTTVIQARNNKP